MQRNPRGSVSVLTALLLAGCAMTRVVPLPAPGVRLDPGERSATVEAGGVEVVARPSAWRAVPSSLPDHVTPFLLRVVNGTTLPLRYDHADLRLFDEARFQYTALPPADVVQILRSAGVAGAPTTMVAGVGLWGSLYWPQPWLWDPWYWRPSVYPSGFGDVLVRALPVGTLDPGARVEGFVYFPRLRPDAHRVTLELHHRLGETPRVLILPFAVERASRPAASG